MIVGNGNHLLACLLFVPTVADCIAPFLATVFEPSPCRIERSNFCLSSKCLTEAMKAYSSEPSSDHRAKSLKMLV